MMKIVDDAIGWRMEDAGRRMYVDAYDERHHHVDRRHRRHSRYSRRRRAYDER